MLFNAKNQDLTYRVLEDFGDERITVTNKMLLRDGKPWLPVMGEMHYSRVSCERWEETLVKMKESGIEIVASYSFWNHHEEEKGVWNFSGNRDVRRFVETCHKVGLEFCLRIGPWSHGEARNGGFPDWLMQSCGDSMRTDREPYFSHACNFIRAMCEQVRGCRLFAIQIENELEHQPVYMEKIRQLVVECGVTAPLFTATICSDAELPLTVLPMYGGYPEAPWAEHTRALDPNPEYFFSHVRWGGNYVQAMRGEYTENSDRMRCDAPFMFCELGSGNQVTFTRRPLFVSRDIEALPICKLGNGANLLGYYMYTGGVNPVGKTTMQESKATGYPNDCPVISYDFQSPIGDMGQLRESWVRYGMIHRFVHSFGEMLAPMNPVMPETMPTSLDDTKTLRCALRTDGKGGFLFVNNHIRLEKLPARKGYRFDFAFDGGDLAVELDVPEDSCFFIPVNLTLGSLRFAYITAQPVEHGEKSLTLVEIPGLAPEMVLPDGSRVALAVGVNRIGETDVVLLPFEPYVPTALTETTVEQRENRLDPDLLMGHLPLEDRTNEYIVRWNDGDKYLVIRADGNVAGFYVGGEMISDQYLYGDAWVIDLRSLEATEGYIKIQPFSEEERGKHYLEVPFVTGVHAPRVWVCREDRLYI